MFFSYQVFYNKVQNVFKGVDLSQITACLSAPGSMMKALRAMDDKSRPRIMLKRAKTQSIRTPTW